MSGSSIGAMRHRLTLESLDRTPDGAGGVTETWTTEATVWGEVKPLSGGEAVEAGRLAGRHRFEIRIRYRAGVDASMRFRLGARVFHILSLENWRERNIWLVAFCEEREL